VSSCNKVSARNLAGHRIEAAEYRTREFCARQNSTKTRVWERLVAGSVTAFPHTSRTADTFFDRLPESTVSGK
jgi:hypothetical protein